MGQRDGLVHAASNAAVVVSHTAGELADLERSQERRKVPAVRVHVSRVQRSLCQYDNVHSKPRPPITGCLLRRCIARHLSWDPSPLPPRTERHRTWGCTGRAFSAAPVWQGCTPPAMRGERQRTSMDRTDRQAGSRQPSRQVWCRPEAHQLPAVGRPSQPGMRLLRRPLGRLSSTQTACIVAPALPPAWPGHQARSSWGQQPE